MTLVEKILARHVVTDAAAGVPAVAPGDACFVRTDLRFSHEYVTPMAANAFEARRGRDARADPGSVLLFRDHLSLLGEVMPEERKPRGLLALADSLATRQEEFAAAQGIRLHGAGEGICHSLVLERYALPGQVVVGLRLAHDARGRSAASRSGSGRRRSRARGSRATCA